MIVPPVVVRLVMVPLVDQKLVAVKLVEEALVIVPVVENKVGAVRMEVEALTKLVWPLTVSAPPRYVLPVEWTEKREPGVVVPMPTIPSLLTNNSELVAELIFKAAVVPVALETLTAKTAMGELEPTPK